MNEQTNSKKVKSLSDKVFMQGIITCVLCILLSIIGLSSATWAWFTVSVGSAQTTIQPSDYVLTIEIHDSNGDLLNYTQAHGRYHYTLAANDTYTVTLKALGTSGNGYAIMFTDGVADYLYTNLISIDGTGENPNPTTFTIITENEASVSFDLRWGQGIGNFDITNGDTVTVSANNVSVNVNSGSDESESESESETESESASESISETESIPADNE